ALAGKIEHHRGAATGGARAAAAGKARTAAKNATQQAPDAAHNAARQPGNALDEATENALDAGEGTVRNPAKTRALTGTRVDRLGRHVLRDAGGLRYLGACRTYYNKRRIAD